MINVDHSACLLLAGSFEPAYILTITTLPSQLQPTTNKRNAALIQSFMADILSVPPERGVLRFKPIPEENLATNGVTIFGEMERVERQQAEDEKSAGAKRAYTREARKSLTTRKSALRATPEPGSPKATSSHLSYLSATSPRLPAQPSPKPLAAFEMPVEDKRKSLIADRRKSMSGILQEKKNVTPGLTATPMPVPKAPPIPQEKTAKVQKRKSFLSVFRSR